MTRTCHAYIDREGTKYIKKKRNKKNHNTREDDNKTTAKIK